MQNVQQLLKAGTVQAVYDTDRTSPLYANAWVQVLSIRKMASTPESTSERYRLVLSDGKYCVPGMLMTQLGFLIDQNKVTVNCILKLGSFVVNNVRGKRIMVVRSIELNEIYPFEHKIGDPVPYAAEESSSGGNQSSAGNQPQVAPMQPFSVPQANVAYNQSNQPTQFQANQPLPSLYSRQPAQSNSAQSSAPQPNAPHSNFAQQSNLSSTHAASVQPQSYASNLVRPAAVQTFSNDLNSSDLFVVNPISSLNPYQNKWTIKARVTTKSDIKKFTTKNGESQLFNVTLADESGEIKLTGFGDSVNQFFGQLELNRTYLVSKCSCKIAKRQFSTVDNEYELYLEKSSEVKPCVDDVHLAAPKMRYVKIADLGSLNAKDAIDVIGIVRDCGDLQSITVKATGKQTPKRDVTLADASGASVRVTLWASHAEKSFSDFPVLSLKGTKVSDYSGRTLTGCAASTLNPDVPEAYELRGWFDSVGRDSVPTSVSVGNAQQIEDERKTIAQIKGDNLGRDKDSYFALLATIVYIKGDGTISYAACPTSGCSKKVTNEGPNSWRCEKCQKVFDHCDHRYILSLTVGDDTGQTWLSTFNDTGETLLKRKAADLYDLKQTDEAAYQQIVKAAAFQTLLFKVRARAEVYQNEAKVRLNVMSVSQVDYVKESNLLLAKIQKFI